MNCSAVDSTDTLPEFDLNNTPLHDHILIEASAGTGKTYTITRLFIRLLLEYEYPVSSILVVTFTEAATRELKERVYLLIRDTLRGFLTGSSKDPFTSKLISRVNRQTAVIILQTALHNFDTAAIHTIHGFCQKVLHENSFESGLAFESTIITEQTSLIQQITNDFWRSNFYTESPAFIAYAIESDLSPQKFKELARIAGNSNRNLKIIPEAICSDYGNEETSFYESFQQLRFSWNQCRDEVIPILENGSLKAPKYSLKIIREIVFSMDMMLSTEMADPVLFERFENFFPSNLKFYTKKNLTTPEHNFFYLCEKHAEYVKRLNDCFDLKIIDLKKKFLHFLNIELVKRKTSKGQLYFDDLLNKVHSALKDGKQSKELITTLRNTYKVALIDEFQDTDSVQYEIFSSIFDKNMPLFFIGDPKQSIYGFRNADIFTYLHASRQITSKYTLYRNYRSDPSFLSALNTLFLNTENQFVYDKINYPKAIPGICDLSQNLVIEEDNQASLKFLFIDEETISNQNNDKTAAICAVVVAEISNLLSLGQNNKARINSKFLSPSDFAILVRTNREAELMQKSLSLMRIPSVVDSGSSVFEASEAVDIQRFLTALIEPNRADLIRAVLVSVFFNLDAASIEELYSNQQSWELYLSKFLHYHDLWRDRGFMCMFRYFLAEEHIRSRLLSLENGERHLTNILHLSELLHLKEQQQKSGMTGLLAWLSKKINDNSLQISDEEMLRLETDTESVTIITIHKSKGLEFPVVFCPFWHNSEMHNKNEPYVFHDPQNYEQLILSIGPEEIENNRNLMEKELLAENMRLLYVALTRAKSCCYLVWGKLRGTECSALAYLLHKNDPDDSVVSVLKAKVKTLSSEQIWQTLSNLNNLNPYISVARAKAEPKPFITSQADKKQFSCLKLNRSISESWKISSFSSLTRIHHSAEFPDYDSNYGNNLSVNNNEDQPVNNIFTFPKGSATGTFLHSVFEKINFNEFDSPQTQIIIEQELNSHGFDQSWNPVIIQLVKNILKTPLNGVDLNLSDIPNSSCIKEMEFCFPLKKITHKNIQQIFSDQIQTNLFSTDYNAEKLFFSPTNGYMKGYIDLIFKWKKRYYLLDWKSNHLGNDYDNYNQNKLLEVMKNEHYTLQYHIYLAALDKYLELRDSEYSYQKDFGGVYYVFLRGVDGKNPRGIFFDKPDQGLIMNFRKTLLDL